MSVLKSMLVSATACALALQMTACVPAKPYKVVTADDMMLRYLWIDSIDKTCAKKMVDIAIRRGASDSTHWGRTVVTETYTHIERWCRITVPKN